MAFTVDRPTATLTQLNLVWTTIRDGMSPDMPSQIQVVAGQSNFSVIDIYDSPSDSLSQGVLYKRDVIRALITRANGRKMGFFQSRYFPDATNAVNSFYIIEVRDGFNQAAPGTSILPNNNFAFKSAFPVRGFYLNQNYKPWLTSGSTNSADIQMTDSISKPSLLLRAKYYVSTNTFSVQSFIQSSGLGTYASNIYASVERFDAKGYGEWNYGIGRTYTATSFLTLYGYNYWYPGSGITLGSIETFDDINWPQGISPGSSASGDIVWGENLTSQIDGISTTFSTDYAYETDTLSVYWNGQRQYSGTITELNSTTFSTSFTPTSGDVLIVDYDKSDS